MKQKKHRTRQGLYRIGTCKITVTVDNEDKVRVHRKAMSSGYKDDSSYLRSLIHEAVWNTPLLPEDYDTLKQMRINQEMM